MDIDSEHGPSFSSSVKKRIFHDSIQGIAVHEELVYEVVRHAGGILIAARDRLEHLTKFLSVTESIGSITGTFLWIRWSEKNS